MLSVLATFRTSVTKISDRKERKGFLLLVSGGFQSIMLGKAWHKTCGRVALHIMAEQEQEIVARS